MSFCRKCGTELDDNSICPNCLHREANLFEDTESNAIQIHCPKCKSTSIQFLSELSSGTARSVAAFSNVGVGVGTTSKKYQHKNYWICTKCGHKFRNPQDVEEEYSRINSSKLVSFILTAITLLTCIISCISLLLKYNLTFHCIAISTGIAGFAFGIYFICMLVKSKNLKSLLLYLNANCF